MTSTSDVHTTIDLDAPPPVATGPTSTERFRTHLLAGATVLGPLLMIVGIASEPDQGSDSASGTEMLAAIAASGPDRLYASYLLSSIGLVLLGAGGLTVLRLVRGRGGALATAGGVLAMISGTAAATGLFMYASIASVMASPDLDREAMGALQDVLSESPKVMPAFMVGFLGGAIAFLLIAGALWRSRVVPVWVPALIVLAAVAFFLVNEGGVVQALTLTPLLVAYGALARQLERSTA